MQLEAEFTQAPERRVLVLTARFKPQTMSEIPALWQDLWSRDWSYEGEDTAGYGVSYAVEPDGSFSYGAGRLFEPVPEPLPEGACVVSLSAGRYAVFRNQGPVAELPAYFGAIFSQWLPSSGERQREGAVFERYPYSDNASPASMPYEIWVPVL